MNVTWKGRKRILECGKRKGLRNQETGEWFVDFPIVSKFGPIPLAQYPVDGKFPSGFELDIDLKEALDILSREESTLDIVEGGRGKEIIKMLKESPSKPRRRRK